MKRLTLFTPFLILVACGMYVPPCIAQGPGQQKFNFGAEEFSPGFKRVAATGVYSQRTGYGFEPGATVTAHARCVTCEKPFLFSVHLPEGNYRVVMSLGDEDGESATTVKAEARRLMLENVRTAKGEIVTREITVNIRTPRIIAGGAVRLKEREKDTETV